MFKWLYKCKEVTYIKKVKKKEVITLHSSRFIKAILFSCIIKGFYLNLK